MIKLTRGQLEAFVKLATSEESVDSVEFLPNLKPVQELVEYGLATEFDGFYKLRKKGRIKYSQMLERIAILDEAKSN